MSGLRTTARRLAGALAGMVLLLAVSGCVGASPSATSSSGASQSPGPSVTPYASVPSDSANPSLSPPALPSGASHAPLRIVTPAPNELGPFVGAQIVVNGLAVRTGPGTSFPMVAAHRWDPATNTEVVDEVRLDAGYYTYVEQGPLVIEGIPWYLVGPRWQPGEADEDVVYWDAGWVAGASGGIAFVVAAKVPLSPAEEQHHGSPEPNAVLYARGDARSATFHLWGPTSVEWYAADPEGSACDMSVILQPNNVELTAASVEVWGHDRLWNEYLDALTEGDYWLEIVSDCSWSVTVRPIIG